MNTHTQKKPKLNDIPHTKKKGGIKKTSFSSMIFSILFFGIPPPFKSQQKTLLKKIKLKQNILY